MDVLSAVLQGLPMTLWLTASAFIIGAIAAVPLSLGLNSSNRLIWLLCRLSVDLVRGIPVIVWLFLLKFGIQFDSFRLDPVSAAILGLGIVSTAYLAEIYRGGLQSVPSGQVEAAAALGLGNRNVFFGVRAPLAFRIISPSIATYLMSLLKDSSIASTIIVAELVYQSQTYARQHPDVQGILPYILVGAIYILLSLPVAYASRRLDARMRKEVFS